MAWFFYILLSPQIIRIQVCKILHCNVNEIHYNFRLCDLWNKKSVSRQSLFLWRHYVLSEREATFFQLDTLFRPISAFLLKELGTHFWQLEAFLENGINHHHLSQKGTDILEWLLSFDIKSHFLSCTLIIVLFLAKILHWFTTESCSEIFCFLAPNWIETIPLRICICDNIKLNSIQSCIWFFLILIIFWVTGIE